MMVCADVLQWAEQTPPIGAHALLADPPYHLAGGFMGADWDKDGPEAIAFRPATWAVLARHLLPGAFLMAFASSRGYHRLACALEDAGLILQPSIFNYRTGETVEVPSLLGYAFGSGFPKSTRIDSQIDAAAGVEQDIIPSPFASHRVSSWGGITTGHFEPRKTVTAPATPLAQAWAGHRYGGQALKPALEPIIVAQVPYHGRPVDSMTQHGAGALNIEGGRVGQQGGLTRHTQSNGTHRDRWEGNTATGDVTEHGGRWPANLTLQHSPHCQRLGTRQVQGSGWDTNPGDASPPSTGYRGLPECLARQGYAAPDGTETVAAWRCAPSCAVAAFEAQAGERKNGGTNAHSPATHGMFGVRTPPLDGTSFAGDAGPASRFFQVSDWSLDVAEQLAQADPVLYTAKASRAERDAGIAGRCGHPTMKPLALTRWLATLLLPPALYAPRRILIPFAGVGSECIGALLAGWEEIIGIERDAAYCAIAEQRLTWWRTQDQPALFPPSAKERKPPAPRQRPAADLPLFTWQEPRPC